jgi:hypothetical protein
MQLLQTLPFALLLLGTANAYKLTFYVGEECNSEEVDVVSGIGGTCSVCSLDINTLQF